MVDEHCVIYDNYSDSVESEDYEPVEKTIGAFEARRQFGRILQGVLTHGDTYLVERNGAAVAAVVPLDVYEQWKRRREAFFDELETAAGRADLTPAAADALANEAVQAVRADSPGV